MSASKKECQRIHAKRRFEERYGSVINRDGMLQIIRDIQAGRSFHLGTTSHRCSVHEVWFKQKAVVVVYDRERKNIITFLPPRVDKKSVKS